MAPEATGSLFDPEGFGAGGFLDDVDCVISEARVVTGLDTPMKDTDAADGCFVKVVYDPDGEDQGPREEYYSLGKLDKFTPSKDNKRVVYEVGTKINKSSKSALFFAGLINAGFPKAKLPSDGDVTFLEGLHVHVNNVPMPEFKGKSKRDDGKDKKYPPSVVLVTKILEDKAGQRKATRAASGPVAKPNSKVSETTAAGSANEEAEMATTMAILEIVKEKGMASKRLLPTEMMERITDAKLRTVAFKLIGDMSWLGGEDRPWSFDAGKGEISPAT